jgi:hypothetical protein
MESGALRYLRKQQIRANLVPALRKFLFHFRIADARWDYDIVAFVPVRWSGDTVFVGEMELIDDPQYFVEIATHVHWAGHHQADLLARIDDEDRAHGGSTALTRANHRVELCHLDPNQENK